MTNLSKLEKRIERLEDKVFPRIEPIRMEMESVDINRLEKYVENAYEITIKSNEDHFEIVIDESKRNLVGKGVILQYCVKHETPLRDPSGDLFEMFIPKGYLVDRVSADNQEYTIIKSPSYIGGYYR